MIHKEELIYLLLLRKSEMLDEIRHRWSYKSYIINHLFLNYKRRISRDESVSALDRSSFVISKEKPTIEIDIAIFMLAIRDS